MDPSPRTPPRLCDFAVGVSHRLSVCKSPSKSTAETPTVIHVKRFRLKRADQRLQEMPVDWFDIYLSVYAPSICLLHSWTTAGFRTRLFRSAGLGISATF